MVEYVDIVDDDDNVIGKATWKEMMDKSLLHRTSNVIVFNSKGKLFVHKRAATVRLYPSMYDIKIGGSVRAGESYEDAAKRELFEEVNISEVKLIKLFKLKSRRKENNVNRTVFKCVYDGKLRLDKSEVSDGSFANLDEIKKLLDNGKLSPSAVDVLSEYLKRNNKKWH
ncbi:NUDIX domain-containing protein [Candidatus Woesearchaeota archaeon]|nr:NUDIX domain-containing protein [Candidatus Woesearchaeota archaeon]